MNDKFINLFIFAYVTFSLPLVLWVLCPLVLLCIVAERTWAMIANNGGNWPVKLFAFVFNVMLLCFETN